MRKRTRFLFSLATSFSTGAAIGAVVLYLFVTWRKRRRAMLRFAPIGWADGRRPIVAVTGSGSREEYRLSSAVGAWCARCGFHLLTGGGAGVMKSVSRAFQQARDVEHGNVSGGIVLAVLPGLPAARASEWTTAREEVTSKLLVDQSQGTLRYSVLLDSSKDEPDEAIVAPAGYPNDFVELAIRTHLPSSGSAALSTLSRAHINVLSSDVVIALPGGRGTAAEIALAVRYGVPVCYFLGAASKHEDLQKSVPCFTDLQALEAFVRDAIVQRRSNLKTITKVRRSITSHVSLESLASSGVSADGETS